jgi:hypothetical protein
MPRFIVSFLPLLLLLTHADQECQGNGCPIKVSSLLQANKRDQSSSLAFVADSNRDKIRALHNQTESHYLELSAVLAAKKALPGAIADLVEMIKNHSAEIRVKLSEEHAIQSADLNTVFEAIATCDTNLQAEVAVVEGDDASSPKSVAAAAKVTLCDCRKEQAKATAESTGCSDELFCYETVKNDKLAAKNAFLVDSSGAAKDMYSDSSVDKCANSGDWQNHGGATNDEKALAWFESQKAVWDAHWDGQTAALEALIDAYNAAKLDYDNLQVTCATLDATKVEQVSSCATLQSRATMDQCYYRAEKKNACDVYEVCRDDAEEAWTAASARETVDSDDRKNAWVASVKIECLIGSISEDAEGNLQIDANVSCEDKDCDTACTGALDLSDSLARTWSARASCTLPDEPCAASATWSPTCSAAETSAWGSHTPAHKSGTAPDCSGSPVAVSLEPLQAVETCQTCSEAEAATMTTPDPQGKAAPAM